MIVKMRNKTILQILIITCSVIFMGMSNKTDLSRTIIVDTTDCEKIISQCEQRILVKEDLLIQLKTIWARNPSRGLEKVIITQQEQLILLRTECAEKIDNACDPIICPSCGTSNSPFAEFCFACGAAF